jgi:3-oxoacyl-[acyl-carrier protein] reductase
MGLLSGRVVLVTGASRRIAIGAGIARRLVADGAAVFLHSWSPHDEEQAWGADPGGPEALLAELHQRGGHVAHLSLDLADPQAPAALVEAAVAAHPDRAALAEYGRAATTLHLLAMSDPDDESYRRAVHTQLTVQESQHPLARKNFHG